MSSERTCYRTCPLCEATCGLEITVRDDQVTRIRGDAEDVFSHGYICPKATTLQALHEDPDRLRRPLLRRGDRHVEVDWDEAYHEIAKGISGVHERGGRNAVGVYIGNPNVHNLAGSLYLRPLLRAVGTQNLFSASTVDQMPKHVSCGLLFGNPSAIPVPDLDRTSYLLMLGANPFESNGSLCTAPDFPGRLKALRGRGGKLVVIDPRRTRTAREADEHHFIRPGSDPLLLLGIIHHLFEAGLCDLGRLADFVTGEQSLRTLVGDFSPERVGNACGIAPETIRRLAGELAEAPSAAVYGRIGTHTVAFGTLSSWAVDVINILTGNLDSPGGAMFSRAAHGAARSRAGGRGFTTGRWRSRVKDLPEVRGELPVATLADEIESPGDGQVRALLTIAGNPVLSTPDSDRLDAALGTLDFMVSVDIYCNETTRHADVILPPPSPLERSHYDAAFYGISVRNVANYSPPVFEASGPPESEILSKLALIFGGSDPDADPAAVDDLMLRTLAEAAVGNADSDLRGRDPEELVGALGSRPGPERIVDFLLRAGPYGEGFGANAEGLSLEVLEKNPHGVDLGPLEPRLPEFLSTPNANIELAPDAIAGEIRRLEETLGSTPPDAINLIGRRHVRSNNSWMHNVPALVSGRDRCTLHVHPDDARRLGLAHGGEAEVASRVGALTAQVEITEDIMQGVVSLPHGWGHDLPGSRLSVAARHPGVNTNRLTDGSELDPLSGNAVLNGIPVTVKPVAVA